ncbi:hypothetical protein [Geobacter anodireducens]|uniref:Uncharacterized protein n=1 Tax=Geobacter anodireducens TaxID=1340425 RepID=A0ABR9NXE8_9BACT|nr:hypothetical protein [Geobacter anodireducens]ANA40300.1 hypothetical protein A2G06_08315 [Geobacter anodireducens]MBE2888938.1 hypothetical protein [Geobacter anodireducens]
MIEARPALPVDIDRLLLDVNTQFNPLRPEFLLDFHVSGAQDGLVYVSFALPEGMTRLFVSFLQSMAGFFRFVDIKARSASAIVKAHDPAELEKVEVMQKDFHKEVCEIFDQLTADGVEVKEAVRRTNSALKASGSPWATYETISSVLRSAGRFRRRKGVKR